MKKFITALLVLCVISVSAHEFWLQPGKFIYKKGETANIKFKVGENWAGNRSKINFLTFYNNETTKDIANLISDNNGDSLQLILLDEGTAMVAYNGLNSFIELQAEKFNDYLKEDGLKDAIEYRRQHNETDSMSHEFYQRSVKTILQVGKKYDNTYSLTTKLPVDIIPLKHPYEVKNKQEINFKVLFQQKPLANHLIKIWHRINNKTIFLEKISDENGEIKFTVTTKGKWMVSTVQMIRLQKENNSQWQSYWGSCTWGYE
jgi:uncharacterized GH25 family protein